MSTETKQTIRVGNGKKRKDSWLTASICIDKLEGHIYEYNGKRYVNLNINIKPQPDQYGKDVELSINEYKPISNASPVNNKPTGTLNVNTQDNDLPF